MPTSTTFSSLAVIGPSGSGKSTIVRALAARRIVHVHPTWTTRPPRSDELHGCVEHRFVDDASFDRLAGDGFFLDTVQLFGLPFRYGLPCVDAGSRHGVDVVMLRAPLVARFAALVGRPVVYQIEDARAEDRLRARHTAAADLTARLRDNDAERVAGRAVADRVFVNDGSIEHVLDRVASSIALDFEVRAA